jgi:hypothetical protein
MAGGPMPRPKSSGGSGCLKFFFFILILFILGSYFSHRAVRSPQPTWTFNGGDNGGPQSPMVDMSGGDSVTTPRLAQDQAIDKNGWVGVEFHANCRLSQPGTGRLVLTFSDAFDRPLPARNNAFAFASDGRLAASSYFNTPPLYLPGIAGKASSGVVDVGVLLPYDQLQLPPGEHTLHVRATLLDSTGRQRAVASPYLWSWSRPASYITRVDVNPRAYSGRHGGNGISIKADFYCELSPHDGGPALLTAHFIDGLNNSPISVPWSNYRDGSNNLVTSTQINVPPGRQVYRGIELFLPDEEIPAANNNRDLAVDLRLYDTSAERYLTASPLRVSLRRSGK